MQNVPLNQATFEYCAEHSTPPAALFGALERETHLRTLSPQMLSGPYQGMLLRFISLMIRPHRILEVGTFTGYAALCLAEGLDDGGILHTIEINKELGSLIHKYIREAGRETAIQVHFGDAAEVIPRLDEQFDLVFLDAGKLDYPLHYELALAKLRPGGFMLIDNVLWDGKVAGGDTKDETARALRAFNDQVHGDPRVENIILPVRDGLMLLRRTA
ncbi:MAG: O-methyltransferase [Lewinellaceae bacterium]|nr:O-methyltransferase [Lewinellaceae bacterium]